MRRSRAEGAAIRLRPWTIAIAVVAAGPGLTSAPGGEPNGPAGEALVTSSPVTGMLLDRPPVPITPPVGVEPPASRAQLPASGSMVVDRLCRLAWSGEEGWPVLTFEPEPGRGPERPRRALPCRLLEEMENVAARSGKVRFRVSGETALYHGHCYLLLHKVVVEEPPAPSPPPAATPAAPPVPRPAPAPTTQPAPPAGTGDHEPSSDEILQQLMKAKVGRPITVAPLAPQTPPAPSVAPVSAKPLPAGSGSMVVDRLVRILPELTGTWWAARFEADNTLQEPPLRLLPCEFLQKTQQTVLSDRTRQPLVFRLSGQITEYRGKRYVLIRKVLREQNLGRF